MMHEIKIRIAILTERDVSIICKGINTGVDIEYGGQTRAIVEATGKMGAMSAELKEDAS